MVNIQFSKAATHMTTRRQRERGGGEVRVINRRVISGFKMTLSENALVQLVSTKVEEDRIEWLGRRKHKANIRLLGTLVMHSY